jgi:Xaa-Pro aminopeptidase
MLNPVSLPLPHPNVWMHLLGAEFRCYTADISRTFPVSGRFTARQRDLHNAVLALQSEGLSHAAVPGADWAEVQAAVRRLLVEQLADLGLTHGSIDAQLDAGVDRVFMPHGLGHFLGLDVHDVSDVGPVPRRLEPGHVITVEPGDGCLREGTACSLPAPCSSNGPPDLL